MHACCAVRVFAAPQSRPQAAEEAVKSFGTELATPVAVSRELRQSNATGTPWWWGLAMLFKVRPGNGGLGFPWKSGEWELNKVGDCMAALPLGSANQGAQHGRAGPIAGQPSPLHTPSTGRCATL
jgi:hypothetical protein